MLNEEEEEAGAITASIIDDDEEEEIFEINHDKPVLSANRKKPNWCGKFLKTLGLSAAFLALGLCLAVPGPTLLDLKDRVGATIEHMSYIFTARSIGYLFGSILGGFLFDHFDQQLQLSYTLLLTSIATIAAPWCTSLIVLAVMISFQGIAMGVLDTGGNVFCLRIWGHQSGPYLQAMHFMFGIGAFIAPLLTKPFLAPILLNDTIPIQSHLPVQFPGMSPKHNPLFVGAEDFYGHNQLLQERYLRTSNSVHKLNTSFPELSDNSNGTGDGSLVKPTLQAIPTTTMHRPKKPESAKGSLLKKAFADGSQLGKHLKNEKQKEKAAVIPTTTKTTPTRLQHTTKLNGTTDNLLNNATNLFNISSKTFQFRSTKSAIITKASTITQILSTISPQLTTLPHTTPMNKPATKSNIDNHSFRNTHSNKNNVSLLVNTTTALPLNVTTFHPQKPETFDKFLNNAIHAVKTMSNIQFAYMIIGAFLFFISIFFMCLYCYDKSYETIVTYTCDRKHKSFIENQAFRVQALISLFIFFFLYVGMEVTFGGFIMTFAVQSFTWSKDKGVILTSLFWGALATGRGLSIFLARCMLPSWMLIANIILVLIATLILSIGLKQYEDLIWPGTLLFGLGLSSIFPTGMSWAEHYMTVTGKATAVLIIGSALGEMVIPAVTGFFMVKKQKMVLMYVMFGLSLLSCLCFIIMQNLASNQRRKYERANLLSLNQQRESLMNGSSSDLSLSAGSSDITRRKHVTFKLDHERVKYNRLHSSEEE